MYRFQLNVNDFDKLTSIPNLNYAMSLFHIINTLRSAQRYLIETDVLENEPVTLRNRVYCLLNCSCFTYEGMKTTCKILKKISGYLSRNVLKDVAWIIKEVKDKNSVYRTILENIRNNIGFHFRMKISQELLKKSVSSYPPIFLEGSSTKNKDMTYIISDNYVANYFKNDDSESSIRSLIKTISDYNLKLCDVLDKVISDLLYNYADFEKK